MATACVVVLAPNFLRALTTCISTVATLTFSVLASASCRNPRASQPRHSISRAVSGLPVGGLLFKADALSETMATPALLPALAPHASTVRWSWEKILQGLLGLAKGRARISALSDNAHCYTLQGQNDD